MRPNRIAQITLFAILFLFFLQVLSDFIQSIYAFGLLVTAFTIQLASVLLLFTPLALILLREAPRRGWIIGMAAVATGGRLLEPMLDPGGRLVACGVSVGAFMLLFPSTLAAGGRLRAGVDSSGAALETVGDRRPITGWPIAWGLLFTVMLLIFFRTAGSSLDISEVGIWQVIAWLMAAVAGRLIWSMQAGSAGRQLPGGRGSLESWEPPLPPSHEDRREASLRSLQYSERPRTGIAPAAAMEPRRGGDGNAPTGRVLGLCIGLASVIVMLYFAFLSPTVIARWTGYSYTTILVVLVEAGFLLAFIPGLVHFPYNLSGPVVAAWNALFVLMLVLTIVPHQVVLPTQIGAYPFEARAVSPLAQIPLYAMLLLWPVVFIDFMLYLRQLSVEEPTIRQLGFGFALAALFILVMVFLHVFTTIYDYAAPIGPLFRDRFWLVYLLAGLGLVLPVFLLRPGSMHDWKPSEDWQSSREFFTIAITVCLLVVLMPFIGARVVQRNFPPKPSADLRVMTYNIQQGFAKAGAANLPGQLDAIRQVAPDVLGLQESDTARVANGNVDAVRYFASSLGMYSYYGPSTTVGTFGIALLSKYPIQNAHTFFMYSTGEQTAAIQAQIVVNGKPYNVFVTHLGNDGDMIQLQNVMKRVDQLPNVLLMGDFNFTPTTAQYQFATRALRDAWRLRWPTGKEIWQPGGGDRIDEVFVSPGMQVLEAEYVAAPSSDHPYLYVVVKR